MDHATTYVTCMFWFVQSHDDLNFIAPHGTWTPFAFTSLPSLAWRISSACTRSDQLLLQNATLRGLIIWSNDRTTYIHRSYKKFILSYSRVFSNVNTYLVFSAQTPCGTFQIWILNVQFWCLLKATFSADEKLIDHRPNCLNFVAESPMGNNLHGKPSVIN